MQEGTRTSGCFKVCTGACLHLTPSFVAALLFQSLLLCCACSDFELRQHSCWGEMEDRFTQVVLIGRNLPKVVHFRTPPMNADARPIRGLLTPATVFHQPSAAAMFQAFLC
jgi:hypothetical protein